MNKYLYIGPVQLKFIFLYPKFDHNMYILEIWPDEAIYTSPALQWLNPNCSNKTIQELKAKNFLQIKLDKISYGPGLYKGLSCWFYVP